MPRPHHNVLLHENVLLLRHLHNAGLLHGLQRVGCSRGLLPKRTREQRGRRGGKVNALRAVSFDTTRDRQRGGRARLCHRKQHTHGRTCREPTAVQTHCCSTTHTAARRPVATHTLCTTSCTMPKAPSPRTAIGFRSRSSRVSLMKSRDKKADSEPKHTSELVQQARETSTSSTLKSPPQPFFTKKNTADRLQESVAIGGKCHPKSANASWR